VSILQVCFLEGKKIKILDLAALIVIWFVLVYVLAFSTTKSNKWFNSLVVVASTMSHVATANNTGIHGRRQRGAGGPWPPLDFHA